MSRFNQEITISSGTITRLEIQKKRKDRVNIFLDQQYACSAHIDIVLSYQLDKGYQMTAERFSALIESDDQYMAYQYGLRYALTRNISVSGCKKKLLQQGFDMISIDTAIEKLIENDYLSDERFARYYCEMKAGLIGKNRIMMELMKHGIDRHLANQLILEVLVEDDQLEEAERLARKKLEQLGNVLDHKNYAKVYGLLSRKGFTQDITRKVMDILRTETRKAMDHYDEEPI